MTNFYIKETVSSDKTIVTSEPVTLPINTANVSNFYLLKEKELNYHGYFAIIHKEIPKEYDPNVYNLKPTYTKVRNKYHESWKLEKKSQSEIDEIKNSEKYGLNQLVNSQKNRLLDKIGNDISLSSGKNISVDVRNEKDLFNISLIVNKAKEKKSNRNKELIKFRGSDNTVYELTNEEMIEIGATITNRIISINEKSWEMKSKISDETITTTDQILREFIN